MSIDWGSVNWGYVALLSGIGLRPREARHRRERGSTRCQMQKTTAGKFHDGPGMVLPVRLSGCCTRHERLVARPSVRVPAHWP